MCDMQRSVNSSVSQLYLPFSSPNLQVKDTFHNWTEGSIATGNIAALVNLNKVCMKKQSLFGRELRYKSVTSCIIQLQPT